MDYNENYLFDKMIKKFQNGKEIKRAFVSARISKLCTCKNRTILVDSRQRICECSECGAIIDNFDVVSQMLNREENYLRNIEYLLEEKETLTKWMLNNRMGTKLREIASNIRRGLIPYCPNCEKPFDLEELNGFCSKEYAIALKQQQLLQDEGGSDDNSNNTH